MTTAATDQERTLTFPNIVSKQMAENVIRLESERQQERRRVEDMLGGFERAGRILDLGDESYVVEAVHRGCLDIAWAAIVHGRRDRFRFPTLDEALLRAVELRNGGGSNDQGHIYAARMLGAGKPAGEVRS